MIDRIHHIDTLVAACIPLALPVIESLVRLIPSERPLSLLHAAAALFHGLGDLAATVASGLDAVVPQKLAAPAAPAVQTAKE